MTDRSTINPSATGSSAARRFQHPAIDDDRVVDRYLAGDLTAAEVETFESHYLTCARCLDALETEERISQITDSMAERGELATYTDQPAGRRWWPLAAMLLVGLLPALLMHQRGERLQTTLENTRDQESALRMRVAESENDIAQLRQQLLDRPAPVDAPIDVQPPPPAGPNPEIERIEREMARLRTVLDATRRPQTSLSTLRLSPSRSADERPSTRVQIEPTQAWIIVTTDAEPPFAPSYSVELEQPDGSKRPLGDAEVDVYGSLTILLPTVLLAPGIHRLTFAGPEASDIELAFEVITPQQPS